MAIENSKENTPSGAEGSSGYSLPDKVFLVLTILALFIALALWARYAIVADEWPAFISLVLASVGFILAFVDRRSPGKYWYEISLILIAFGIGVTAITAY